MDKRILLPLVILPAFQTGNMQAADQPAKRPNIILFMVDDMGWEDTSLPFWTEKTHYNEVYETPNMERLARQGVMFTQAYASSISSPSRCSLITGTNAARHRVTNWTLQKDKTTDRKDHPRSRKVLGHGDVCDRSPDIGGNQGSRQSEEIQPAVLPLYVPLCHPYPVEQRHAFL